MTHIDILIRGIMFGLGAAIPIGPINVEIARRSLLRGWSAGVCFGMGAVSVDVTYALLSVVGVAIAAQSPWVYWPVALGGIALLLYLGVGSIRAAVKALKEGWKIAEVEGPAPSLLKAYLTGVAMTATSPLTLAFWFGGLASQAATAGITGQGLAYLAGGVFLGTCAWVLTFSTLMSLLGRWRKPWWMAVADFVGGLAMLAFAGLAIWGSVRRFTET